MDTFRVDITVTVKLVVPAVEAETQAKADQKSKDDVRSRFPKPWTGQVTD